MKSMMELLHGGHEPLAALENLAPEGDDELANTSQQLLEACSGKQLEDMLAHASKQQRVVGDSSKMDRQLILQLIRTAPALKAWSDVDLSHLLLASDCGVRPMDILLAHCPLRHRIVDGFLRLDVPQIEDFLVYVIDEDLISEISDCLVSLDDDDNVLGHETEEGSIVCPVDRLLGVCHKIFDKSNIGLKLSIGLTILCEKCSEVCSGSKRLLAKALGGFSGEARSQQGPWKVSSAGDKACSVKHQHLAIAVLDAIGSCSEFQSSLLNRMTPTNVWVAITDLFAHHGARRPPTAIKCLKFLLARAAALVREGYDESMLSAVLEDDFSHCFMEIFYRITGDMPGPPFQKRARIEHAGYVRDTSPTLIEDAESVESLLSLKQGPPAFVKVLMSLQRDHLSNQVGDTVVCSGVEPGLGMLWVWMVYCVKVPRRDDWEHLDITCDADWMRAWGKAMAWLARYAQQGRSQNPETKMEDKTSPQTVAFIATCVQSLLAQEKVSRQSVSYRSQQTHRTKEIGLPSSMVIQILNIFWTYVGNDTIDFCAISGESLRLVVFGLDCSRYCLDSALDIWAIEKSVIKSSDMSLLVNSIFDPVRFVNKIIDVLSRRPITDDTSGRSEEVLFNVLQALCKHHVRMLLDVPLDILQGSGAYSNLVSKEGSLWHASLLVTGIFAGRDDILLSWRNGVSTLPISQADVGLSQQMLNHTCKTIVTAAEGRELELLAKIVFCCLERTEMIGPVLKAVDSVRSRLDVEKFEHEQVFLYARSMASLVDAPNLQDSAGRFPRNIAIRTLVNFFSNGSRNKTLVPTLMANPIKILVTCAQSEGKVRKNALMALAELVGSGSDTVGLGQNPNLWSEVEKWCENKTEIVRMILSACTVLPTDGGEGLSGGLLFIIAMVKNCTFFKLLVTQSAGGAEVSDHRAFADVLGSALSHQSLLSEMEADPESLLEIFPCCAAALQDRRIASHFISQGYCKRLGSFMMQSPLSRLFSRDSTRALGIINPLLEAILRWRGGCVQLGEVGVVTWLNALASNVDRETSPFLSRFAERVERVMKS